MMWRNIRVTLEELSVTDSHVVKLKLFVIAMKTMNRAKYFWLCNFLIRDYNASELFKPSGL